MIFDEIFNIENFDIPFVADRNITAMNMEYLQKYSIFSIEYQIFACENYS